MSTDADCVKVAVRIRPLVKPEIDKGCQSVIDKFAGVQQVVVNANDVFSFNYVFSPDDTQQYIYETSIAGMLEKLFKGYNVTILAYGQTGSGKTHTMGTAFNGSFDSSTGVIPRAVCDIFERISTLPSDTSVSVSCSFVELYQEQLYDLLSKSSRNQSIVDIREDGIRGIIIPGLTETVVTSAKETTECLIKGSTGRAVGATAMNTQSSRSHAIFTVNINVTDNTNSNNSTQSKFHLVDLAGSERAHKTKATGDRFKEGVKINQGLLALGNVISALGCCSNSGYVGYRDSKLTRLLQDSLGGNSVTLMIACVSPADYNMSESLSTLRYADRARKIKNKPIINQDPKTAEINRLNGIIQKLRMELLDRDGGACLTSPGLINGGGDAMRKILELKNRKLQHQLESTLNDVTEIEMRAVCAESARDELQEKLMEAKNLVLDLSDNINENTCPAEFIEQSQKIRDLRKLFNVVDEIIEKNKEQLMDHKKSFALPNGCLSHSADNLNANEAIQQKVEAFTSKQFDFHTELQRLNRELNLKEELQQKVTNNLSKFCSYEGDSAAGKMKEFESMIQILEAEKNELCEKLKSVKGNASAKIAEDRRLRLQQLEAQINELKKKNLHQEKLLKLREKESQKIDNLNKEIQAMKATKVKLVRAMRSEAESFRQWKLNREKELTQLKEKDRKRQNEMVRMESLHNKQKNVLKRKVEEAVAANKRLKDTLEKQKVAQAQRKNAKPGKVDQIISMVGHELDIIIAVIDAENSLEHLMEDRAVINNRLNELKETEPDNIQEINAIEEDLQMRNAQINDIQQKIIASDIEAEINAICENLQTLSDSRAVLRRLFTAIIDLRKDYANKLSKINEYTSACENSDDRIANLEREIEAAELKYREELSNMEKTYEEKITVLLRELNTVLPQEKNGEITPEMDERIKIQHETLDKLDSLREELDNYKNICNDLREQLANVHSFKKPIRNKNTEKENVDEKTEFLNFTLSDTEEDILDNSQMDPDWVKTPRVRRTNHNTSREKQKPLKRSSDGSSRCSCKGSCRTLRCSCRKSTSKCSENCKCSISCCNKYTEENTIAEDVQMDSKVENSQDEIQIQTPKKAKLSADNEERLDVTTPLYPYAKKQRKPFFD